MRTQAIKYYEAFKRANGFGTAYSYAFPAGSYGSKLFNALAEVIKEMDNHFQSQITHMNAVRGEYDSKAAAKDALLAALKSLSRNARNIDNIPGIAAKFDLRGRLKEQEILSVAKSFAEYGATYYQQFIDHDMRADFLTELNELIGDYQEAMKGSVDATNSQVKATAGIDDCIDRGMELLEKLDVVVIENKFPDDKLIIQAWRTARHIERPRKKTPKNDTTPKDDESSKPKV